MKELQYKPTHTRAGRCVVCGRKRAPQKRKPFVVAMTLRKGWRLIARPLSFRVQTLRIPVGFGNGNVVWTDVQRFPRTRNAWLDDELMCAVSMFHRRFREWEASSVVISQLNEPPLKPPSRWEKFQKFFCKSSWVKE